jgi:hypothetical protein
VKAIKTGLLWLMCIAWGLLILRFIPRFRLITPFGGTGTAATLGQAFGAIVFLLFLIAVFVVLLRVALATTRAQ